MRTIYKYLIQVSGKTEFLDIPGSGIIRHVGFQEVGIHIWVEVHSDVAPIKRGFRIFGTGHPIPPCFKYVGTVQAHPFVWHVYEET